MLLLHSQVLYGLEQRAASSLESNCHAKTVHMYLCLTPQQPRWGLCRQELLRSQCKLGICAPVSLLNSTQRMHVVLQPTPIVNGRSVHCSKHDSHNTSAGLNSPTGLSRSTFPSLHVNSSPTSMLALSAYQMRILLSATTARMAWSRASSHFSLLSFSTCCNFCRRCPSASAMSDSLRNSPTATEVTGKVRCKQHVHQG